MNINLIRDCKELFGQTLFFDRLKLIVNSMATDVAMNCATAIFGADPTDSKFKGEVMWYSSTTSASHPVAEEGCNPTKVDMSNMVVIIARGPSSEKGQETYCKISRRARYAQAAWAIAVIIQNEDEDPESVESIGVEEANLADVAALKIPICMISKVDGDAIKRMDLPIVVKFGEDKEVESIVEAIEFNSEIIITLIEFFTKIMSDLEIQSFYYTENFR